MTDADTLQAVIDANPQGVFALDRELRYTAFNRAHAESMRALYGAEVALGGRLTDYQTVTDDRAGALTHVKRALGGERVVLTASSGAGDSRRSFEIVHTPQRDATGSVVGVIVRAHEVTERREAEAALSESEAELATSELYFRRFFDESPVAAAVVALDHRFLRVNAAMERFTGYSSDELAQMTFLDLTRPDERESDAEQVAGLVRGESQEFTREKRYVRKDGSEVWGLLSVRIARDDAGDPLFHLPVIVNVTELKRAQEELQHFNEELEDHVLARTAELEASNKELEAFIYSVSHDLRAPLRAIDGFSQIVVDDAGEKLTEDDLKHLQRVRAGAQRMAVLIDGLLGLSRASRRDMLIEQVDVSDTAASVLRELDAAEPGREVETVIAPDMVAAADATLLRDVLANLLGNAWKFTSKHGTARIEVGVCDADGERAFFVRDDGAGFDPAYATHLFGAFQRMHQAGQFEGDGIGLATVKRLVTRMGGHVWAEAEVEKGATFYFTLPQPITTP